MTKEGLRRSDSFSEITPAPETTPRQEQSEVSLDSISTFEETRNAHISITSHHEEQASSSNNSRSCLSSILDKTPMSFLKAGIGFSSLAMVTSAGVLIFNNNPDNYTSALGTNKTIEHRAGSTDEFTRTFASLMILSTISCLSFCRLYEAKNAKEVKQEEEQKNQTSSDRSKASSEKEEESIQREIPSTTALNTKKYDLEALKLEISGMDQEKFRKFFTTHHDILPKDDRENIVRAHLQQLRTIEGNTDLKIGSRADLNRESVRAPYFKGAGGQQR